MTDRDAGLMRTFAILPEHEWQERYGGMYSALATTEREALQYALRLLEDPEFEAAENARLGGAAGPVPAIPEAGKAERAAWVRKQLAALEARENRGRLSGT